MNNEFLDKFKEETKEEISKLNYKKYFYQFNDRERDNLVEELKEIEKFFYNEFEVNIYPVYGTLLGLMREGDFINHDTDIDMAYLSKCHTEKAVLNEFNMICDFLKNKGLLMWKMSPASHIHVYSPNKRLRIDMWISWIDNNGKYYLTWIFDGEFNSSIVLPFKKIEWRNQSFNLMNDSPKFLNYLYHDFHLPICGHETKWKKIKPIFRLEPWNKETK